MVRQSSWQTQASIASEKLARDASIASEKLARDASEARRPSRDGIGWYNVFLQCESARSAARNWAERRSRLKLPPAPVRTDEELAAHRAGTIPEDVDSPEKIRYDRLTTFIIDIDLKGLEEARRLWEIRKPTMSVPLDEEVATRRARRAAQDAEWEKLRTPAHVAKVAAPLFSVSAATGTISQLSPTLVFPGPAW